MKFCMDPGNRRPRDLIEDQITLARIASELDDRLREFAGRVLPSIGLCQDYSHETPVICGKGYRGTEELLFNLSPPLSLAPLLYLLISKVEANCKSKSNPHSVRAPVQQRRRSRLVGLKE